MLCVLLRGLGIGMLCRPAHMVQEGPMGETLAWQAGLMDIWLSMNTMSVCEINDPKDTCDEYSVLFIRSGMTPESQEECPGRPIQPLRIYILSFWAPLVM
jgi:hypothetical protein